MRIIYWNNCWFTNVGEAFIDIGSLNLLKHLFPDANIMCMSCMSQYYTTHSSASVNAKLGRVQFLDKKRHDFELNELYNYVSADYLVLSGMFATTEFLSGDTSSRIVRILKSKGSKIIFLGLGGLEYDENEISRFKAFLKEIKPALIMTRDSETYRNYRDCAPCIDGIDCAFWCRDSFYPQGFATFDYDIVSFNRSREVPDLPLANRNVIRPWHFQYSYDDSHYQKNILISDTPYDYLSCYANASRVYTDLVHGTIVSLMYGVPVKSWFTDKRCKAIEAVKGISVNSKGFRTVSYAQLQSQKIEIEKSIRKVIGYTGGGYKLRLSSPAVTRFGMAA